MEAFFSGVLRSGLYSDTSIENLSPSTPSLSTCSGRDTDRECNDLEVLVGVSKEVLKSEVREPLDDCDPWMCLPFVLSVDANPVLGIEAQAWSKLSEIFRAFSCCCGVILALLIFWIVSVGLKVSDLLVTFNFSLGTPLVPESVSFLVSGI